ncbi:MAG: PD40 domain-containing protein [Bacteroidales bacterium]|nr:MAG: PD40 domain-containing protein [Bacteroidales bacterium]
MVGFTGISGLDSKAGNIHSEGTVKMKLYFFSISFVFLIIVISCNERLSSTTCSIAYSSDESGNPEIYLTDSYGKSRIKITSYPDRDGYPAWSPDGKYIAFYAYHGTETWSIHTMNIDGTNRKRLTFAENKWDNSPTWSPDGTKIVFAREYNDTLEIWIMNSDGSELRQIKTLKGGGPCFTPDGKILFHSQYKYSEICIADIDGNNIHQLTNNNAEDWHPEISPDGEQVAFMSDRDGNYEIYIMNIDGSNQKRLTYNTVGDWEPSWSPDGSEIVFTSYLDGDSDIYIMNADGSSIRNITNNTAHDLQPSWLKMH